jgi:hypothetical protein
MFVVEWRGALPAYASLRRCTIPGLGARAMSFLGPFSRVRQARATPPAAVQGA